MKNGLVSNKDGIIHWAKMGLNHPIMVTFLLPAVDIISSMCTFKNRCACLFLLYTTLKHVSPSSVL